MSAAAEALGVPEILASILSFAHTSSVTWQPLPDDEDGPRVFRRRAWNSWRAVNRLWKGETDRLLALKLAACGRMPWQWIDEWPYSSRAFPDDASSARRAVTRLQVQSVPRHETPMHSDLAPGSIQRKPVDQHTIRELFLHFPSLKVLHVKFPRDRTHARVSGRIGPSSYVRIPNLRLFYNRPRNRFALFVDLTVDTWDQPDDESDDFKYESDTGSDDSGSQDHVTEWSGQSTFYRSIVQLVKRRARSITSIEVSGPWLVPSIFEVIEALGFDPAELPASLQTINAPPATVLALDVNYPQWHKLKRISILDPDADYDIAPDIVDDTDLRRFAGIVARSPQLKEIELTGTTCPSSEWHPLVLFLRSIAEQTQAPSSIQNICVSVDDGWENADVLCPTRQAQSELDLRSHLPHLQRIKFDWPNVSDTYDGSEIAGLARATEIAALLTVTSASQIKYVAFETAGSLMWEVRRVGQHID